jgi:hypothetical protein
MKYMHVPSTRIKYKTCGCQFCTNSFFNSLSGRGGESKLGPLGTSATSGLLYVSRVIVCTENLVEERLAGETEVLGG